MAKRIAYECDASAACYRYRLGIVFCSREATTNCDYDYDSTPLTRMAVGLERGSRQKDQRASDSQLSKAKRQSNPGFAFYRNAATANGGQRGSRCRCCRFERSLCGSEHYGLEVEADI